MNTKKPLPELDYLNECFQYNRVDGSLVWKDRPIHHFNSSRGMNRTNAQFRGKVAGHIWVGDHNSYAVVKIKGVRYYAHRIIWKMLKNDEPVEVDHININSLDNRIQNLRSVTPKENSLNKKMYSNNASGEKGVYRKGSKWEVQIRRDGKLISYGLFSCIDEAIKVSREKYKMLC